MTKKALFHGLEVLKTGIIQKKSKHLKYWCRTIQKTFFPYNDTALNSKTLVPHQDGSVVSMSNSWPGGCEFHTRFRQTSFSAYFHLSPSLKHLRKVVGVIEKKVVSAVLWKQGHAPGNITDLNDMTLAVNPFPNDKF